VERFGLFALDATAEERLKLSKTAKSCIICSNEFIPINGASTCGSECRLERKRRYARLVSAENHRRNKAVRMQQKLVRILKKESTSNGNA